MQRTSGAMGFSFLIQWPCCPHERIFRWHEMTAWSPMPLMLWRAIRSRYSSTSATDVVVPFSSKSWSSKAFAVSGLIGCFISRPLCSVRSEWRFHEICKRVLSRRFNHTFATACSESSLHTFSLEIINTCHDCRWKYNRGKVRRQGCEQCQQPQTRHVERSKLQYSTVRYGGDLPSSKCTSPNSTQTCR